jgi:hypothetical protein
LRTRVDGFTFLNFTEQLARVNHSIASSVFWHVAPKVRDRTIGIGWWLVLVCSERRVLLAGCWWLVCSERKVLLAGG